MRKKALTTFLTVLSTLATVSTSMASTRHVQRNTRLQIELNSKLMFKCSAVSAQNVLYISLADAERLFTKLKIKYSLIAKTLTLSTPFSAQPTMKLQAASGTLDIKINNQWFARHVVKFTARNPDTGKQEAYIPVKVIIEALQAIGVESSWHKTMWNVLAKYTDYTKTGKQLGVFTNFASAKGALVEYPGGTVEDVAGHVAWTEPSFVNVDLRYSAPRNVNAASLDKYLTSHKSIMSGLGSVFMKAQSEYGVNANYLVSHAMEETGSGGTISQIALEKNNLYGYGAYDANALTDAGTFPSEAYAILFQAWEVRNNYLTPNSSHYSKPTLAGMASNYASDPDWANKVNDLMNQFAIDVGDNIMSYTQFVGSNHPPDPTNVASPPVYPLSGAKGTVTMDAFYQSSVPIYASAGLGHQHMFQRILKQGDVGDDVETLQQALNIQADGIFGAKTAQAVADYQTSHGLTGTPGMVDFNLWNLLNLSEPSTTVQAGQTVQIDGIVQGMAGGQVTEWYHVPSLNGWVNSTDVTLNNVYKITVDNPSSPASVVVQVGVGDGQATSTLHTGDYVVSSGQTTGGKVAIMYTDLTNGVSYNGYLLSTQATLSKVTH